MKTFEIIDFELAHAIRIKLREGDKLGLCAVNDWLGRIYQLSRAGIAQTMTIDNEIFAIGLAMQLWPGNVEITTLTSVHVDEHPVQFVKATKSFMDTATKVYQPHRIQAVVHEDHTQSRGWLEHMGFANEGMQVAYGMNRENFIRYAKMIGENDA